MLHYLEIGFLGLLLLIGSPLSIYSFVKLWLRRSSTNSNGTNRSRVAQISRDFLWLQRSLNLSDIIVIHVYVVQQLIKTSFGRSWYGGWSLCKFVHIASTFGFHLSSNTITSIAIDRLVCAIGLHKIASRNRLSPRISVLLGISLILAFAISVPQCLVWGTAERGVRKSANSTVLQTVCTTVWYSGRNSSVEWVTRYMHIHSLTLSPIPTTIILVCYAIMGVVIKRQMRFSSTQNAREESVYSRADRRTGQIKPPGEVKRRCRQSRTIVVVSLAIVIAYVICWLPYNISTLWSEVDAMSYMRFRPYFLFTWHMIAINAILNPVIYRMTLGSNRSTNSV